MQTTQATRHRGQAAMHSPVHWALLGLLVEAPSHGYELAQRFEQAYEGMLQLSGTSYVYKALDALERQSMIVQIPAVFSGRQPKPRYRATEQGLRAYQDRLVAQWHEDSRRSRLFARQLAGLAHQPDMALEVIERCEHVSLEDTVSTQVFARTSEDDVSGLAARLISEESRLATQAKLPWISYARQQFIALSGRYRGDDSAGA
jgi:DNA-binding PadR family transcriptional regulator